MTNSSKNQHGSEDKELLIDSWKDVTRSRPHTGRVTGRHDTIDRSTQTISLDLLVKGLKVLVLCDDTGRLLALKRQLGRYQIEVFASSPDEVGYRKALEVLPDAIISQITKPGEPSWRLFQNFRRHPLLKWTPVLMMDWWKKDANGKSIVAISKVKERIAESLSATKVLMERIEAGRPLSNRVSITGVLPMLKTLSMGGVTGNITINDSWNVFEGQFSNGKLITMTRRGADGTIDTGDTAFFQAILTDSGRWSFQQRAVDKSRRNIKISLPDLIEWTRRICIRVFGPTVALDQRERTKLLIRLSVFTQISSTLSAGARQMTDSLIKKGLTGEDINRIIADPIEQMEAEKTFINLARSGAFVILDQFPNESASPRELAISKTILDFLSALGKSHRFTHKSLDNKGLYSISKVSQEYVSLGSKVGLKAVGAETDNNGSVEIEASEENVPSANATRPSDRAIAAGEAIFNRATIPEGRIPPTVYQPSKSDEDTKDAEVPQPRPRETFAPSPHDRAQRGTKQMWAGIVLAIILGGLLVAGLVVVKNHTTRKENPVQQEP